MKLVALREHAYNGRRIKVGQEFEISNLRDAQVLCAAHLAKKVKVTVAVPPTKKITAYFNSGNVEVTNIAQNNEELSAININESTLPDHYHGWESDEKEKKSRRRRRYKRRDMDPEK